MDIDDALVRCLAELAFIAGATDRIHVVFIGTELQVSARRGVVDEVLLTCEDLLKRLGILAEVVHQTDEPPAEG